MLHRITHQNGAYRVFLSLAALALLCASVSEGALATDNYSVSWASQFTLPPQDAKGWSILNPSSDSRLIYVSNTGDDASAQPYSPSDSVIGSDPYNPVGAVKAYATITAAMAQARQGYPDYVLLKRGDTWILNKAIIPVGGRSLSERAVIGYYGTNVSRPLVEVSNGSDAILYKPTSINSVVMGIYFYSYQRDPSSPSFVGFANVLDNKGFSGYVAGDTLSGILIEDCRFDYFSNNSLIGAESPTEIYDFAIRRNVISNNYAQSSHSQGIYSANASLLIEGNVFDHNGWYKQSTNGGSDASEGQATIYNHNIYFSQARNMIIRRNIFMRPSSIDLKFTSNAVNGQNIVRTWNVLIDDNLVLDGEVGISLGGNDDYNNGPRWQAMYVVNNVMMEMGTSRPTVRSLGWGLDVNDWDTGVVDNNIIKSWGNSTINNVYAMTLSGVTSNVSVDKNIFYDVTSGSGSDYMVKLSNANLQKNISMTNNDFMQIRGGGLISLADGYGTMTTSGNAYYSSSTSSLFQVSGTAEGFSQWSSLTGESSTSFGLPSFTDPARTIETYLSSMGQSGSMTTFSADLMKQSKFNWNTAYTANAINDYIRAGFCLSGQTCVQSSTTAAPSAPQLNVTVQPTQ